jgi:Asp-tRNA(Asn)/Glu-tRNA(Gln) amidotransferase A subunit family amidase
MKPDLADLTALDARDGMARGAFRAAEYVEACLARVDAREAEVGAFAFLDKEIARANAKACDGYRATGRSLGSLHGLPVAVKDIIDTADMPTENGTPIDAGRKPKKDAVVGQMLRRAGAVVMGKTVTTELASMHPRGTRNPHHAEHTPGGSSSGSAAAVAAGMAPLALGTQTNGSVIRPASYCGIVGFKPSFGLIPRTGVLLQCRPLDTVGVFARTVADAAVLADALAGFDAGDPDTRLMAPPRLLDVALTEPPVTPALAFVKGPAWERAEPATVAAFAELTDALREVCEEMVLPDAFAGSAAAMRTLTHVGLARNYGAYYDRGAGQLSDFMRGAIEEGRGIAAVDYLAALDQCGIFKVGLEMVLDSCDAIVTPAAAGEAPRGFDSTGDPAFCSLWSLCGVPAISLPLLQGPNGLPVGVQLVGRRGEDARLLRTARWLATRLAGDTAAQQEAV